MFYFVFKRFTGFNINLTKSELVRLSDGSDESRLARVLGCKTQVLPINYQGIPLGSNYKDERI